jgi:hypothetical protein
MLLQLIALAACGPLDRLRGHERHILGRRVFDKLAYGIALAVVAAPADPLATPFVVVAMMLGMSPGWGEPMSSILDGRPMRPEHLEWWQKGPAAKDPWLALTVRGVIWGLPVVPVAVWFQDWSLLAFLPAFAFAMPVAMFAAKFKIGADKWGNVEWARGWIAGALLFLSSFI